jgi:hypothetical protein
MCPPGCSVPWSAPLYAPCCRITPRNYLPASNFAAGSEGSSRCALESASRLSTTLVCFLFSCAASPIGFGGFEADVPRAHPRAGPSFTVLRTTICLRGKHGRRERARPRCARPAEYRRPASRPARSRRPDHPHNEPSRAIGQQSRPIAARRRVMRCTAGRGRDRWRCFLHDGGRPKSGFVRVPAARLSSWSMPHRKHGVKTRVAFVPAAAFAVGFPS